MLTAMMGPHSRRNVCVRAQVRREMGQDIAGACGQLVVNTNKAGTVVDTSTVAVGTGRCADIEDFSVSQGGQPSSSSAPHSCGSGAGASVAAGSSVVAAAAPVKASSGSPLPWLSLATMGFIVFLFRLLSLVVGSAAVEL